MYAGALCTDLYDARFKIQMRTFRKGKVTHRGWPLRGHARLRFAR